MERKDKEEFWAELAPVTDELVELATDLVDRIQLPMMIAAMAANHLRRETRREQLEAADQARSVREAAITMMRLLPAHAPEGSAAHEQALKHVTAAMEAWADRRVETKRATWREQVFKVYGYFHSRGNVEAVRKFQGHLHELMAPADPSKLSGLP